MSYRGRRKGSYGKIGHAKRVQARRSDHAKAIDRKLKAPKARSVDQWLSAPNRYDLPNIDTNKPQKKTKSCRITKEEFSKVQGDFDRLVDKDDVSNNPKNKEAYREILNILDNAKISYYIGKQHGVYVPIDDMEKATKLTDQLYETLKKTS